MFNVNDMVIYGARGVCEIVDISKKDFNDGKERTYYVLRPAYDTKATIFVPVSNEALTSKMRHVLSSQEIYDMIKAMPDEATIWIENENQRKEKYREILTDGSRLDIIKMIKSLYAHEQDRKENGKKLSMSDERFMKAAEKVLYDEFAVVLHIEPDEVLPFIMDYLREN